MTSRHNHILRGKERRQQPPGCKSPGGFFVPVVGGRCSHDTLVGRICRIEAGEIGVLFGYFVTRSCSTTSCPEHKFRASMHKTSSERLVTERFWSSLIVFRLRHPLGTRCSRTPPGDEVADPYIIPASLRDSIVHVLLLLSRRCRFSWALFSSCQGNCAFSLPQEES